jgi:hypothetical protein
MADGTNDMADDTYERLRAKLPEIASAVKTFDTTGLQERAFDALVQALLGPAGQRVRDDHDARVGPRRTRTRVRSSSRDTKPDSSLRGKPQRARRGPATAVKGLDFRPSGPTAFTEFARTKAPATLLEKNAAAVFYMSEFMQIPEIGVGHVLAAFREAGWKPAPDPAVSLRKTASAKGWIDTSSTDKITMTPSGSYFVEHQMPTKKSQGDAGNG